MYIKVFFYIKILDIVYICEFKSTRIHLEKRAILMKHKYKRHANLWTDGEPLLQLFLDPLEGLLVLLRGEPLGPRQLPGPGRRQCRDLGNISFYRLSEPNPPTHN